MTNEIERNPNKLLLAIYPDFNYQRADQVKREIVEHVINVFDGQITFETTTAAHLVSADFVGRGYYPYTDGSRMYSNAFLKAAQAFCLDTDKIEMLSGLWYWTHDRYGRNPLQDVRSWVGVLDGFVRLTQLAPEVTGELPKNQEVLVQQFYALIDELKDRGILEYKFSSSLAGSKTYRDSVLSLIQQAR